MRHALDTAALAQLFTEARTHNAWRDEAVAPETLRQLYDLAKWGPTAMNISPLRVRFVQSAEARARLLPLMAEGNRAKTGAAPVVAILGRDVDFHTRMPTLAPHMAAVGERLAGQPTAREAMSTLNGGLQIGYFILAARSLGLDCGPMGGFDAAAVDAEFWAGTAVKSLVVCNLGYGDPAGLRPRAARLDFDDACAIV
ncbi:malonic semialdehyde reductase [Sphaerotilus microaerophilus]|jgi:3-hydroxypropanoate dehydrogenase|uniref:Putative NADH dehydrogenase/NAD(P)H nitroreductase CATMQ487_42960 n=1 Tax=Sphaerotilus microaerophilus TaxID=2914710 RepID=A0ABN6PQ39_9BURK|nr:malonic semialdehyde reductase [Sphaerotilus sp. FB-5]BDI07326.1 putative NADH dehydrogenase/NAD(P)H nitroreductase [Sphaerotilus sp. FB-5]